MELNWITAPLIGIFLAGLIAAGVYAVTNGTIISILVFLAAFIVFPSVFSPDIFLAQKSKTASEVGE